MSNILPLRKFISFASRGISPHYVEKDGIIVLNQKCIRENKISLEPARLTDKTKKISKEKKLRKFDILVNSTGIGTLGRVAQLTFDLDATVDSHVSIFRISSESDGVKIDPEYIGYSVRFRENEIEALGKGATGQTELSKDSVLDNISIYFPDFPSQTHIASILSTYDDLIENNEKRIKVLEEMAERLYLEWFVKFKFPGHEKVSLIDSGTEYGKIPDGWEVKQLASITKYLSRGLSPKYDKNGSSIVINQKCIRNHRVNLAESRRQRKIIPPAKQILFGDILINSTGVGTLGRVAQVYDQIKNCTVDTHVTIVRPIFKEYIDFLGLALFDKQSAFERMGAGATGQTELSRNSISCLEINIPPLSLVTEFSQAINASRKIVTSLRENNRLLTLTRDLLIPQLVTGKSKVK